MKFIHSVDCLLTRVFFSLREQDPGPWIVATESASRPLALRDLPPEIVVVDLDTNTVTCSSPSALSKGGFRDRARRRLQLAVGNPDDHFAVPLSIVEAFPFGKFRPFSEVEVEGKRVVADRLAPEPSWNVSFANPFSIRRIVA